MNLIKCPNNHLYNADHFPTCPYCSSQALSLSSEQLMGANESDINTAPVERSIEDINNINNSFIVGWLVCIEGKEYGNYFPLYSGTNAIGRGSNMDIWLKDDLEISRLVHAQICYNTESNTYTLNVKDGVNPVYINGTPAHAVSSESHILCDRDRITIGTHTFIIIELCNEDFSWR